MRGLPRDVRAGGGRRARAFSMAELAVVLVIVAAMAMVAIPRMTASAVHARLQSAGREAAAILSAVRDEARASSTTVAVRFDPLGGTMQASVVDPDTKDPVSVTAAELDAATDDLVANDGLLPRLKADSSESSRKAAFLRLRKNISRIRKSTASTTYIVTEMPDGVRIVSADLGGDDAVIFRGHGEPDSGGTIVLGIGDDRLTVTVNAGTGAVTLSR